MATTRRCSATAAWVAAVEARAGHLLLDVTVRADDALRMRRLDADVEAAAYFVICEALTNVVKQFVRRGVDHLQQCGGLLAVVVGDVAQAGADQVHLMPTSA